VTARPDAAPGAAAPVGDALALAARIADGRCSAAQALDEALAAVARLNPTLNAVCHVNGDAARVQAEAIDAQLGACRNDGERAELHARRPFLGVPLLLKDLGAAALDLPSTLGSRLAQRIRGPLGAGVHWPVDSALVARYRAAGFVPFGRTAVPEMGISPSTEARANGGPTRNPFDTAHSAGGSSGGAAAAVAGGMVRIAHANDGAGSIRIPASCCGLIGLKPSRGLMPMGPLTGEGWGGLVSDHLLTTSVRDCVAALVASAGADAGAPYAAPCTLEGLASQIERATEAPRRRIALCDSFFEGDPVHPEVAEAVRALARRLEAMGHRVELRRPPLATLDVVRPVVRVVACGTAMAVDRLVAEHGPLQAEDLEPTTRSAVEIGRRTSGAEYLEHVTQVHALGRTMAAFLHDSDLLLTPVLAEPPAPLGRWAMTNPDFLDYRLGPAGLWRYSPFAPLANATGGASIALPAGLSSGGLPIGAMLTGQLGDDALLLQIAAELEAAAC
jgi:amidase